MVNGMKKISKRNLLFLLFALLFLAVLICSLFPKITVASILHLDSKEQIVKVEIVTGLQQQMGTVFSESVYSWRDITDTPLGDRYRNALFSTPAAEKIVFLYFDSSSVEKEVAAVRITIDNLPEDYPYSEREYTFYVGLPLGSTSPINLHYTLDEQKRLQKKLNAEGKGEIAPTQEYHEFDLSHNELFTLDFINKQFE